MKITDYFIKYPVSAFVLNAFFILVGWICLQTISLREYPEVEIPVITVQTNYPSASAELMENSVTNLLEDALAGVEGVETMISKSRPSSSFIELKFRAGISMDRALMATRESIGIISPFLPQKAFDPVIQKASQSDGLPFMLISLESSSMDFGQLTHYSNLNIKNMLRSLKGVASVTVWGQPYTYKLTLDDRKLFEFGVNFDEIYEALEKSKLSLPAGKFQNQWPVTLECDFKNVEDYENLLVKTLTTSTGEKKSITLGMLAKVEFKTDDHQFRLRINERPGVCLAINRSNDGNPLEVSQLVKKEIEILKGSLPDGLSINVAIDQAEFIRSSLKNIEASLFESVVLVLIVVFLFLGKGKAALIPLITIPISLFGSIIFLKFFGFSINIMTLLAMVLAIGVVVDDAIIVLENITRYIEKGFSPKEAALKGAREIGFAIVAMTLTLTSVYMPIVFVKGMVGDLFIEFAIALAGSVLISGVIALTLSPLMCSFLGSHHEKESKYTHLFKNFLDWIEIAYKKRLTWALDSSKSIFVLAALSVGLSSLFFSLMPKEIAPKEDRGLIGVFIPPISGKTIQVIEEKMIDIEKKVHDLPEVTSIIGLIGNFGGSLLLPLKPVSERKRSAETLVDFIRPQVMKMPSFDAWTWSRDTALPGIENDNPLELSMAICTVGSYRDLFTCLEKIQVKLEKSELFESVRHNIHLDNMGYEIDFDQISLSQVGLSPYQVAKTIEFFFSGDQSLSFQKEGMLYPITIKSLSSPWSLEELYMTNSRNQRISLGSVASMKMRAQPKELGHYNQMRSGILSASVSSEKLAEATDFLQKILKKELPASYRAHWVGSVKEQKDSSIAMGLLFALSLVFIYSILAVQFENFKDPFIVMGTVPLGAVGALGFSWFLGQSMNIYTQIGLITLVGLITKHGILIVEFANQMMKEGKNARQAALEAAQLRLRPILMTTVAMIAGSIPLLFSQDAGSEVRRVLGAILIGGLSLGTFFTLLAIPVFYVYMKLDVEK